MSPILIAGLVVVCLAALYYFDLFGAKKWANKTFGKKTADKFRDTMAAPVAAPVVVAAPGGAVRHVQTASGAHTSVAPGVRTVAVAGVQHESAAGTHKVTMADGTTHTIVRAAPAGAAAGAAPARATHTVKVEGAEHVHSAGSHKITFSGGVVHENGQVTAPAGARDTMGQTSGQAVREIVTADGARHQVTNKVHMVVLPNGTRHVIKEGHHEVTTPAGVRHVVTAESHTVHMPTHAARHTVLTSSGALHVQAADGAHHTVTADGGHHAVTSDGVRHSTMPDGVQHLVARGTNKRVITHDGVDHTIGMSRQMAPVHKVSIDGVHTEITHAAAASASAAVPASMHTAKMATVTAHPESVLPNGARRIVSPAATHEVHDGVHTITTRSAVGETKHELSAGAHMITAPGATHIITADAHHARIGTAGAAGGVARHMTFPTGIVRTTTPTGIHIIYTPDGTKHSVHPAGVAATGVAATGAGAAAAGATGEQHIVFPNGIVHRVTPTAEPHVMDHKVHIGAVTHTITTRNGTVVHAVKIPGEPPFTPGPTVRQVHTGDAHHTIGPNSHLVVLADGTHHTIAHDGTHHAVTHDGSHHTIGASGVHQVGTAGAAGARAPVTHVIEPNGTHHSATPAHKTVHTVFADGTARTSLHANGMQANSTHKVSTADGVTHTASAGAHHIKAPDGVIHTISRNAQHEIVIPKGARTETTGDVQRVVTGGATHVITKTGAGVTHKIVAADGTVHNIDTAGAHTVNTVNHKHEIAAAGAAAHVVSHSNGARTEISHAGATVTKHPSTTRNERSTTPTGVVHTVHTVNSAQGPIEVKHSINAGVKTKSVAGAPPTSILPAHLAHALPAHALLPHMPAAQAVAHMPVAHTAHMPVAHTAHMPVAHTAHMPVAHMPHEMPMYNSPHAIMQAHAMASHSEHGEHAMHEVRITQQAQQQVRQHAQMVANRMANQPCSKWGHNSESELASLVLTGSIPMKGDHEPYESEIEQWQ